MTPKDYFKYYVGSFLNKSSDAVTYPKLVAVGEEYYVQGEYLYTTPQHSGDKRFCRPEIRGLFDRMLASEKLILLPLSAMTEEQALEYFLTVKDLPVKPTRVELNKVGYGTLVCDDESAIDIVIGRFCTPQQFVWLTKNHYDLFDLIKNGQAIDATTLPVNPYK